MYFQIRIPFSSSFSSPLPLSIPHHLLHLHTCLLPQSLILVCYPQWAILWSWPAINSLTVFPSIMICLLGTNEVAQDTACVFAVVLWGSWSEQVSGLLNLIGYNKILIGFLKEIGQSHWVVHIWKSYIDSLHFSLESLVKCHANQ